MVLYSLGVATGTGIEVRDDNTPVGTAGTVNFGTN
jgi:hypothetical protein